MDARHASTAPGLGSDQGVDADDEVDVRWLAAVKRLRRDRLVADSDWDLAYPWSFAELSHVHFTPVSVARRAAALLSRGPSSRILDVGSGVGKFCVIAALTTAGTFVGIERWGEMVDVARATARRAHASKATFIHARVEDYGWRNFDGVYLFNPFAEFERPDVRTRGLVLADPGEYERLVSFTQETLDRARPGTRVVTYHGFGGAMPRSFRLVLREKLETDFLECWERR